MDLTDEQRMLMRSIKELAEEEFADRACEWEGELPWENAKKLAEHGFMGINFDEEYGGGGLSEFESMLMIEVVGRVCPDTGYYLNNVQMIGPQAVSNFGTEAAKERYLPPVCAGEDFVATAISEPGAGSDVKAMDTTVEEDGGDLYLNGEKIWVSEVPDSGASVVWVKFPEGLGSVIVDMDAPGIEIGQHFTNMSGHAQTQFFMENVRVPEENVLTRGPDAFREQLTALNWERLGNAAMANGMAAFGVDRAIEYAKDREQFGQPIADFQGIEWKLADMAKELHASRTLSYDAATNAVSRGRVPDRLESSIATLYSAEMAERVVSEALQIHGANGYQRGHPLEYLYRFVRGWRIGAGTDEVQKNGIAAAIKEDGLPDVV